MKTMAFANRNFKELIRDPITLLFGMGLPVILIFLMSIIQQNVKVTPFAIGRFAPGMAVFSLSFISLFAGMLIAKDRSTSFLMRIFASPMTAWDFIAGYSLPLLGMALIQSAVCFIASFFFGLEINLRVLSALAALLGVALLYVGLGILSGVLLSDKQVGGISSLLINIATLMSGTWFDLQLVGEGFRKVCYALPFAHAVDAAKYALSGQGEALPHLLWVLGYAAVVLALAAVLFRRRMRSGKA